MQELGFEVVALKRSLRSHPAKTLLCSTLLYGGSSVVQGREPTKEDIERLSADSSETQAPMVLIDTSENGKAKSTRSIREKKIGTSYINDADTDAVLNKISELINGGRACRDIAVIPPYKPQVPAIIEAIKKSKLFSSQDKLVLISRVYTSDAFHGRESEIVIVPFVRSNIEGRVGFLRDLGRLLTILTREKYQLILIGDFSTLTSDAEVGEIFKKIRDYFKWYKGLFQGRLIENTFSELYAGTLELKFDKDGTPYLSKKENSVPVSGFNMAFFLGTTGLFSGGGTVQLVILGIILAAVVAVAVYFALPYGRGPRGIIAVQRWLTSKGIPIERFLKKMNQHIKAAKNVAQRSIEAVINGLGDLGGGAVLALSQAVTSAAAFVSNV